MSGNPTPNPATPVNSTPPQTPKRVAAALVPLFSPRHAAMLPGNLTRDINTTSLTDISLAPGCELIIWGIGASTKGGGTVAIVQNSVNEIRTSDPQLANIPLNVLKFSHQDASLWFSSYYVSLAKEFNPSSLAESDAEPRVDLLEMWGKHWPPNTPLGKLRGHPRPLV